MSHLKRLVAPKSYPVPRKVYTWVIKAKPGTHEKTASVPLAVLIRDVLKYAKTRTEVKKLLYSGDVLVDGKVRKEPKFAVGFMDTISFLRINKFFRLIFDMHGRIKPIEIKKEEAKVKICKIIRKTGLRKGKIQLTLHDGRNILADNKFKTKDSVLISLPDQKIINHLKYGKGMLVFLTGGAHIGEIAKISDIHKYKGLQVGRVILKAEKTEYETIEDYTFVIGKEESEVSVK